MRNRKIRRRLPGNFGRRPIWVSPDARLNYMNFGASAFDSELLQVAKTYIRNGDLILDVGANCGEFALAAAHQAGSAGATLAVEPDPFLGSLLAMTILESGNKDVNLHHLSCAVSSTSGLARFFVSARGRAASALATSGDVDMGGKRHEFLVPMATIDQIATFWRVPNFVKIDVEGEELRVLQGAKQTLLTNRPLVYVEIRKDKELIRQMLPEIGYLPFDPKDREFKVPLAEFTFNTLLVPKEMTGRR